MQLSGSIFSEFVSVDAERQRVTVAFGGKPDAAGRVLDLEASAVAFDTLKGSKVYAMGKGASIGAVVDVEHRPAAERIFVEIAVGHPSEWRKVAAHVYSGVQARAYDLAKHASSSARYACAPGGLQLVDVPFEDPSQLRKARVSAGEEAVAKLYDALDLGMTKVRLMLPILAAQNADLEARLSKVEAESAGRMDARVWPPGHGLPMGLQ